MVTFACFFPAMWARRLSFLVQVKSQYGHLKGLAPVWTRIWRIADDLNGNMFWQILHLYVVLGSVLSPSGNICSSHSTKSFQDSITRSVKRNINRCLSAAYKISIKYLSTANGMPSNAFYMPIKCPSNDYQLPIKCLSMPIKCLSNLHQIPITTSNFHQMTIRAIL